LPHLVLTSSQEQGLDNRMHMKGFCFMTPGASPQ